MKCCMKTIKPNILDLYDNQKMHIINTFNQILFFINMLWSLLWPSPRCPTDQTLLVKNNNMWLNIFIYVHLLVINVKYKIFFNAWICNTKKPNWTLLLHWHTKAVNYRKCLHMSYDDIVSSFVSNARKPIHNPWSSIPESFQFKSHRHPHTSVRKYLRIKNQTQ